MVNPSPVVSVYSQKSGLLPSAAKKKKHLNLKLMLSVQKPDEQRMRQESYLQCNTYRKCGYVLHMTLCAILAVVVDSLHGQFEIALTMARKSHIKKSMMRMGIYWFYAI